MGKDGRGTRGGEGGRGEEWREGSSKEGVMKNGDND